MTDETTYVAGIFPHIDGRRRKHTARDCRALDRANNVRQTHTGEAEDLPLCQFCAGVQTEEKADPDWSYQRALREAGQ